MKKSTLFIDEARSTLKLGAPIVAAQLAHISLGFIDTVMAGSLGAVDLAAVAIGRSSYIPLFIFVLGTLLVINPISAQLHGAGKAEQIGGIVWQGILLALFMSVPSMFLIRHMHIVMTVMHIDDAIAPISLGYLNAISWSLPASFVYLVLRFFNEGVSLSRPNMYFTLSAIPVNIAGNYLLMYGKLGFPKLGAVGAGWATTAVWYTMLLGMVIYVSKKRKYKKFAIFHDFKLPDLSVLKEILRIGLPNGVSVVMEVGMFAVVALIVGSIDVKTMAAHQIAINFASIVFMVPLGISIATTSRVGYEMGRKKLIEARIAGYAGISIVTTFMCFAVLTMYLFPDLIVRIYSDDPEVMVIAAQLIIMAAIFQLSDGFQVSAAGALRGLKDTKIPMIVNITAYWGIGLPLGYYLGMIQGGGVKGLWTGLIAGLSVAAVSHTLRFFFLSRGDRLRAFQQV